MSDTKTNIHKERLTALRQAMVSAGVDAVIIPSSDPHMSEYLPEHWQGRAWLSGFTGSAGTLVVMAEFAGLWTDSRYWIQAPMQLDGTGITLMKLGQAPNIGDYLAKELLFGAVVAVDGAVLRLSEYRVLQTAFEHDEIKIKTDTDFVGLIWQDRAELPTAPIFVHDERFCDLNASQKLAQVRAKMNEKHAEYHLISSLDDIAWLTNLRGADVSFNPVFLAHMLISQEMATLYVDLAKVDEAVKAHLDKAGIRLEPYENIANITGIGGKLLIDPSKISYGTLNNLPETLEWVEDINPSTTLKAIKSEQELSHIKEAMRQDGAALCEFFSEFEDKLAKGERLSEIDIDRMLIAARQKQPNYVSPSFDTIAGFKGNGAVVHYRADEMHFSYLDGDGLLLIDSGCQYHNGTTDITRMAGVGMISDDEKRDVTYVLKAHIALATAQFPNNIPARELDILARNELWRYGADYGHGTGHGVGYFLNVHEGPQSIARAAVPNPHNTMQKGMVTSNEPGLYRTDKWGIRLENLVVAIKADTPNYNNEFAHFGEFLKFDNLTLCPFDTRLILPELLNSDEKAWLNTYHKRVHDELIDRVNGAAKAWLIARTQPI